MCDEQDLLEIKNVDASLSYGKIYSGRIWNIIVIFLAILAILAAIVSSIGLIDALKDKDLLFSVIAGYVIGGVLILSSF